MSLGAADAICRTVLLPSARWPRAAILGPAKPKTLLGNPSMTIVQRLGAASELVEARLQALLTDKQGVALSESWLARWSA